MMYFVMHSPGLGTGWTEQIQRFGKLGESGTRWQLVEICHSQEEAEKKEKELHQRYGYHFYKEEQQ